MQLLKHKKARLNDGREIPVFGLGTYLSKPNEVAKAVIAGWKCGIRHFDCAQFYRNEHEIGTALDILRAEPGFKRDDIWITSKAWNSHHTPRLLEQALDQTLKDLHTDYLDLYLIHWPVNFAVVPDENDPGLTQLEPQKDGVMLLDRETSLVDTWKAMIEMQKKGKVKSIGVSNFRPEHMKMLIDATRVAPAVDQVEAHPYLIQQELVDFGKKYNVHISAYMPFGGDVSRGGDSVLGNPLVKEIAVSDNKDAGQVLASWGIKRGFSVIPKSINPARIKSNFEVYDLHDASYERLTDLGREKPKRFGGIPCTFVPSWAVNVFDTEEERGSELLQPF